MKYLFTIAVLLLAACGEVFGDPANDQRELTQLVKDVNTALVKADIAFLEGVLHKDYTHYRPRGTCREPRAVPEEPQDRPRGIRVAGCG